MLYFVFLCLALTAILQFTPPNVESSDYKTLKLNELDSLFLRINSESKGINKNLVFVGTDDFQKYSMYASLFGIGSLQPYLNPLPIRQFRESYFFDSKLQIEKPMQFVEKENIKYIICKDCSTLKHFRQNLDYVMENSGFTLFKVNLLRK